MSLEQKIEALTVAVEKLTATLAGAKVTKPVADNVDAKAETPVDKPKAKPEVKAEAKPEVKAETPAASAKELTYKDIQVPFLALAEKLNKETDATKGREATLAWLAKHGLGNSLKNAKPEDYAAILADLNVQLAS